VNQNFGETSEKYTSREARTCGRHGGGGGGRGIRVPAASQNERRREGALSAFGVGVACVATKEA
jgi:hypothetical protein